MKSRKITVLHEGSGDYGTVSAQPKRQPVYMEGLTDDQVDLILLQMVQHNSGKKNSADQTDKVVIVQNKAELKAAMFVDVTDKSTDRWREPT